MSQPSRPATSLTRKSPSVGFVALAIMLEVTGVFAGQPSASTTQFVETPERLRSHSEQLEKAETAWARNTPEVIRVQV